MKVEDLYVQGNLSQVGVTLQRKQFETEIDIFPQLSPFADSVVTSSRDSSCVMSELTTVQTEDRLCKVVKHQTSQELHPPKRIDSGPLQHRIQSSDSTPLDQPITAEPGHSSQHFDLLNEIDDSKDVKRDEKVKIPKKESTLSRMLKGIRKDNSGLEEDSDKLNTNISLSKIFQKMNPVGKTSRDGVSKVFHRIGDALQKKSDDDGGNTLPKEKNKTLERKLKGNGQNVHATNSGEHKFLKIGEKMFKAKSNKSTAEVDKAGD